VQNLARAMVREGVTARQWREVCGDHPASLRILAALEALEDRQARTNGPRSRHLRLVSTTPGGAR
jgi:hypothetical protein